MSSYRALFARSGARCLALSSGLGWLSFAGYGLAIVLAVEDATGSFAAAGAAVAAFSAGSALLAPLRGRFVDRRGPRALAWFAPPHAAALALLAIGCATSHAAWLLAASAGLAGACVPPVVATARALWPQVAGPDLVRAGHAVNAVLGDVAQVVGPALTGAVAALASPLVALALLVPGAALAAVLVALAGPPARRPPPPAAAHRVWGVLRVSAALRTLVVCELALGLSLGALEIAAPAIAADGGAAELAAVPLALLAAGGVAASLWSGVGSARRSAAWRFRAGSLVVAGALSLCPVVQTLAAISVVLCAAGAGLGLLTVALFELLDEVVASERAVEALTWLTTAQGAGLAAGAAGAGLAARGGATDVLVLVAVPAAVATVVANSARI